jgi:hypothetical protein
MAPCVQLVLLPEEPGNMGLILLSA